MTKRSSTARSYPVRIPRIPVGPLAPMVLGEYSRWLAGKGYSAGSAAAAMNVAQRLSMWMQAVGAGVDGIEEELLVRFVAAERSRDRPCASVDSWIGALRRFLTAAGYLRTAEVDASQFTPAQAAVAQWCAWMRNQRGLTEKSIAAYCYYGAGLLDAVTATDGSVQWGRLDASIVNAYVTDRGRPYGVVVRARIVGSVRCLLRWALSTGRHDRDLTAGILKPPGSKRSVPRGVAAAQVAALLAVCDPATAIGARDRALVLMLVRLGLRAGEAARLMLDDIDWASGQLRVTGKGREHVLPLPVDVGQALEAWLRLRPDALDRAVFVRTKAPRQMMTTSGVSGVIARLSGLAGIDPIYAHRLRHTAAMDVLAAGGTLSEAKELLGHVYTVTTMTYAKVDLASLRELVVPFGQVPR
ncbi:tyrosine-type recombinase/integrase [Microbacterium sp.]|uniref:tyrosine-type recombinase/integrase n=1 Tax=Microbacterium sp. TaxID=51671 RepID=UPI0027343637|nr:tyrosine-type recombinase/integrase [Microbacterium sp.]MDP3950642.1 tyrosine-type recombinase/integrase [Microbacterium sp.]